jgi:hypothetical protein
LYRTFVHYILKAHMVKKKQTTTKTHHRRRVRYPARVFGSTGYVGLIVSWFLVIGVAGSIALNSILNMMSSKSEQFGIVGNLFYYDTDGATSSSDMSLLARITLLVLLIAVTALLAHLVAERSSKMLKHFLKWIGAHITLQLFFGIKCILALSAVLTQLVVVLLLPAEMTDFINVVVGVTAFSAAISVLGFAFQHAIARTHHMDVKNIL